MNTLRSIALLSLILTLFVPNLGSTTPLGEIVRGCVQRVLAKRPTPDPMVTPHVMADPLLTQEFRDLVLERRKSAGGVDFAMPEFRPLVEQMRLVFLDEVAKDPRPRSPFSDRVIERLDEQLKNGPRYWATIELAVDLTTALDLIIYEDPNNHFRTGTLRTVYYEMTMTKWYAEHLPVVFVPSLTPLGFADFNRIWTKGIFPLGIITSPIHADGINFGPNAFLDHDRLHAVVVTNLMVNWLNIDPYRLPPRLSPDHERILENMARKAQRILDCFTSRIDAVENSLTRRAIETAFFFEDHESGSLLPIRASQGFLRNVKSENGLGRLEEYLRETPGSGLPAIRDHFWSDIFAWENRNWRQCVLAN